MRTKKLTILLFVFSLMITGCTRIDGKTQAEKDADKQLEDLKKLSDEDKQPKAAYTAEMTKDKPYYDGELNISFLGLEEYAKIGEGELTDKPAGGKKYLVLFLKINNGREDAFYFHPDFMTAKIDSRDISHTIIKNDVNAYQTLFKNYSAGSIDGGFVVYEADENWKKLELTYTGLAQENGNTIHMTFSKKDLEKPEDAVYIRQKA